jgi:hypothetical protein
MRHVGIATEVRGSRDVTLSCRCHPITIEKFAIPGAVMAIIIRMFILSKYSTTKGTEHDSGKQVK